MVEECCIPGVSWFGHSLFLFSFISYFFISFYCLFALVRTSSMMLNRSGEREYPCFAPKLKGKVSSFSPLNMMLSVFFFCRCFNKLRKFPGNFVEKLNGGWNFVKCFFYMSWYMVIWFFYFSQLLWCVPMIYFQKLIQPCIPRANSLVSVHNSFYTLLDLTCWYFMEAFSSFFIRILVCNFPFL